MNLLLLDQFSDPGGAQQGLLDLLPAIRERGWRALVGIPGEGELFRRVADLGFEATQVPCGPYASGRKTLGDMARFLGGSPRLARHLRALAGRIAADAIYINGPRLLPAAALAGLSAPVVFHSHSYLFPGAVRKLAGLALQRLDAWTFGNCRFVADVWRPYVHEERLSVIYNGVAGPERAVWRPAGGAPRVGCIGRIAPEKGQKEFLAAAAAIHNAIPECRFFIYGEALFSEAGADRYHAELRAAAAGLPIEFPGWVEDVYEALAQLDLLLVPSAAHEATTRVILEAYAAGVPMIALRSGGIPEVVDHGRDGFLADSISEMAELAIALLRGAPPEAISRAARDTWARRFTLERYRREVLDALERIAFPMARLSSRI